jgi:hypothetical protein
MTERDQRNSLVQQSWAIHDVVEQLYLQHPASKTDPEWAEKQRLLLADMAIHLLQTALKEGALDESRLAENLFSILTIADQFLPAQQLVDTAARLMQPNQGS